MIAPRGIPTSRAYWELQADKLMNRIFDPAQTIDLETESAPHPPHPEPETRPSGAPTPRWQRARRPQSGPSSLQPANPTSLETPATPQPPVGRAGALAAMGNQSQPLILLAVLAAAGLVTATSGVFALSQWNRFQESLQQERNLLLVERLRNFGPAAQVAPTPPAPTLAPPAGLAQAQPAGQPTAPQAAGQAGSQPSGDLPPPPPQEPWIEQLGELPQPQRSAPILRVPVSPRLAAATQPAGPSRRATPAGPVPLLVGVVAAQGKVGSAIFQMGGNTSTVGVGETIGNSGWRLRSTDGESVLIDHDGDVRQIAIGGGG